MPPTPSCNTVAAIAVIAIATLCLRLAPQFQAGTDWAMALNDSREYIELARGLVSGCGFARDAGDGCGRPELLRTPAYPLFLAAAPSLRSALHVQALLGVAICVLTALLLASRWSAMVAIVGALFVALDASSIVWGATLMSDVLFGFMVFGAVASTIVATEHQSRTVALWTLAILSGITTAAAIATRPLGQFLLVLIPVPFLLLHERRPLTRVALAITVVGIPLLVIAGWSIRNQRAGGFFGFSTAGVYNLYVLETANVLSYASGEAISQVSAKLEQLGTGMKPAQVRWDQRADSLPRMARRAIQVAIQHPFTFLWMRAYRILYTATAPEYFEMARVAGIHLKPSPDGGFQHGRPTLSRITTRLSALIASPMMFVLVGLQLLLVAGLWCGILRAVRSGPLKSRTAFIWIVFPLSAALPLIIVGSVVASPRMRLPAVPLLAIVSALGWFGARSGRGAA
jgi:4-amino-4-deoxy-L-arabinose transferase-like glycosyltransferase